MAKKKTTEAINREQEVMEEKEALPSFFTNLFSSASNPLPNRAVLEYNIMHSAPVKANTEGYRAMMKVDKRTQRTSSTGCHASHPACSSKVMPRN